MVEQTAFGGTLQEVVAMEAIALRPEPLDELIELFLQAQLILQSE